MKALILGGAAALLLGGAAVAQTAQPGRSGDPDARVTRDEFVARHLQRFDGADANRDGVLTAEEARAAFTAGRAERRAAMFARLDTNGDGAISRAEFDARAEARGERGGPGGWRGRGGHRGGWGQLDGDGRTRAEAQARAEAMFARMDANGDGVLTREDREAGRGARGARGAR